MLITRRCRMHVLCLLIVGLVIFCIYRESLSLPDLRTYIQEQVAQPLNFKKDCHWVEGKDLGDLLCMSPGTITDCMARGGFSWIADEREYFKVGEYGSVSISFSDQFLNADMVNRQSIEFFDRNAPNEGIYGVNARLSLLSEISDDQAIEAMVPTYREVSHSIAGKQLISVGVARSNGFKFAVVYKKVESNSGELDMQIAVGSLTNFANTFGVNAMDDQAADVISNAEFSSAHS